LRPWTPQAVDFELAPAGLRAAARGTIESRPIRAPKRFDLVGLRWSSRGRPPAVRVRVRRDGGRWSRWERLSASGEHGPDPGRGEPTAAHASDPLWTGGTDLVQYRLSHRVAGLRLHFVNTTGTATEADRVRTALRRAANDGTAALAALLGTAPAHAVEPRPDIHRRSEWGGRQCRPRVRPYRGHVRVAFIHHTDTATSYSRDDVPPMILAICRYNRNSNGWNDIGYNFLV